MTSDNVKFQIREKSFVKPFDRSKIKLGNILYIKQNTEGTDIEVYETPNAGGKKYAVHWIAPSAWAVTLVDIFHLEHSYVQATQELLDGYMQKDEVLECLSYHASKLRLEHLYKTSEFDESSLRVIFAVTQRLNFIESLKSEEVSKQLFYNWEPVIVYHLLTCFDLLGQPDNWVDFDSWISSEKHNDELEKVVSEFSSNTTPLEYTRKLSKYHQEKYGVKKSFYRFIREILPEKNRNELLDSIKIITNSMPPEIATISEDGDQSEKEKFLYSSRNNYTHKLKAMHGTNQGTLFGTEHSFQDVYLMRIQEFKSTKWITYMTRNWPEIIEHSVKIGLAVFLRTKSSNHNNEYTRYSFKHKYYRAFRPDGTEKPGVNKILFDLNGNEMNREYVPEGLPETFEWATIEEIDRHNIMYPNVDRKALIRP